MWLIVTMRCAVMVAVVVAALVGAPADAWGPQGHRLICEIAWIKMAPQSRAMVGGLLADDVDYATFAESCNWADDLKSDPSGESGDRLAVGVIGLAKKQ